MNVLLLYPKFPDTFWSFKHALKFIRKKALCRRWACSPSRPCCPRNGRKRLVDVNVRGLREKDLAWADVVFISGMIAQRDSARELIARCHAAGKTIVAGGPLFTLEHDQFPEVDHFVLNEAEVTLPEFLRISRAAPRGASIPHRNFPTSARRRATVGTGRPAPLRLDERAVLARLPV